MNKTIRHRFDVDPPTWWSRVFFDPDYLEALHLEGLRCRKFEVVSLERDADGRVHQELKTEPRILAPPVIRKAIGDRVEYRETGVYDPATGLYRFSIIPSSLTSATTIEGVISLENQADGMIDRVCDLHFKVNVRGVGKLIEAFVGRSYTHNIDRAATFTKTWIARRAWGDSAASDAGC